MFEFALGATGTQAMFTALGQPAQQQNKTFFVGSGDLDTPKINQTFKGTPFRRSFFVLYNRKKTIISRRGELRSPAFVNYVLTHFVNYLITLYSCPSRLNGKTQFSPTVLHLGFITI